MAIFEIPHIYSQIVSTNKWFLIIAYTEWIYMICMSVCKSSFIKGLKHFDGFDWVCSVCIFPRFPWRQQQLLISFITVQSTRGKFNFWDYFPKLHSFIYTQPRAILFKLYIVRKDCTICREQQIIVTCWMTKSYLINFSFQFNTLQKVEFWFVALKLKIREPIFLIVLSKK